MFNGVWNFVKRHRKKIIFGAIAVGGIYYCGRYADNKIKDYREKEQTDFLLCAKKQQHFINTQLTCKGTIENLIGNLRSLICQKTDMDALLTKLKNNPSNKLEIWEELKILSITAIVSTMYASCVLVLSLKIQMNLIAGRMLQKTATSKSLLAREEFSEFSVSSPAEEHYLLKIKEFLDDGLDDLISIVKSAVVDSVKDVSLKDPVSVPLFQGMLSSIRRKVEVKRQNGYHDYIPFSLMQFMKFLEPKDIHGESKGLMNIHNKTYEVLSGFDFQATSNVCLDSCFTYLVKRFEGNLGADIMPCGQIKSKPLAKIIPLLNNEVLSLLSDQPNHFFEELLENTCLNNFVVNLYNQACTDEFSID